MGCNPPGPSLHGARILEWVATSFSKGSSWPRDQTHVSCIDRQIFYLWATGKPIIINTGSCYDNKLPTYEHASCELSKMWMCVPSTSDMSEVAACPPPPVAVDPSVLLSPLPLPSPVSNPSFLVTWRQPLYARCCTVLWFSKYCTVRFKMFSLFLWVFKNVLFVWKVLQTYYSTVLYSQLC